MESGSTEAPGASGRQLVESGAMLSEKQGACGQLHPELEGCRWPPGLLGRYTFKFQWAKAILHSTLDECMLRC